ncbi:CLUMA_CG015943, isoform A [Clunio marinus]|uniref:CLUMA_CG015943, isoform A n=1 Tax=Clunio marinus TaxID=568069 RepID=A0A1J1IRD1_9DIPT|nr:CLUMA_CG015943, isoform A [Clunio marinus]
MPLNIDLKQHCYDSLSEHSLELTGPRQFYRFMWESACFLSSCLLLDDFLSPKALVDGSFAWGMIHITRAHPQLLKTLKVCCLLKFSEFPSQTNLFIIFGCVNDILYLSRLTDSKEIDSD